MQWASGTGFKPVQQDKEVTLGPTLLATIGIGLFALCCLCFLGGFIVGRHSSSSPVEDGFKQSSQKGRSASEILEESNSNSGATSPKPAAPAANQVAAAAIAPPRSTPSQSSAATSPESAAAPAQYVPTATSSSATQTSAVHPALAPTATQTAKWIVQIAVVEHAEDADVLQGALRKRGYTVSVHHDPLDDLLHVQVGPFASESDADATRQKLLNDGYNAIVLP